MQHERAAKIFGDREDPRVRLADVFGEEAPEGGQPPERALRWAATVSSPERGELQIVRDLRRAEPRLTLKTAVFLARHFAHLGRG